jgi:ribosomal protein L11 methyltransferase
MSWVEVRVSGAAIDAHDAVIAALVSSGAPGVQELQQELLTHVPADTDFAALTRAVEAVSPGAAVVHTPVGEIDWAARWPTQVRAQRVGRVAVAPPWLAEEIADAELPIVIEPAMAFGTGEHETTRGVLQLMQGVIRPGDRVADLGTGSAVLAIAAAKLGAARVAAIELDPDAIGNAEENVAANGVADRVTVIEGDAAVLLPLVSPVRVILANIISSVLLQLAPAMRDALAPDGRVLLSGILTSERAAMLEALGAAGWALESDYTEGDWWSGVIARR